MNKKIISLVLTLTLLGGNTAIAFAQSNNNSKMNTNISEKVQNIQEKKQKIEALKAEYQQRKSTIKGKIAQIQAIHKENEQLRVTIDGKLKTLRIKLEAIKKNPDSIDSEKLIEIQAKADELQDALNKLKAFNESIQQNFNAEKAAREGVDQNITGDNIKTDALVNIDTEKLEAQKVKYDERITYLDALIQNKTQRNALLKDVITKVDTLIELLP